MAPLTAKTLDWVYRTIADAMRAVRENDQKWVFHSWVRNAMRTQRDKARGLAQAGSEEKAMVLLNYLEQNVGSVVRMLAFRAGTPEDVKLRLLEKADALLERVYFPAYVIFAIERLIERAEGGENNCVSAYFRRDAETAEIVYGAGEKKRASALIERLKAPAKEAIASVHFGPMRSGKTARERAKMAEREPRNRSEEDQQYRARMKGHNSAPPKYSSKKR